MKLAIISDTHDNLFKIEAVMQAIAKENVDYIIHAGDFVAPFSLGKIFALKEKARIIAVFGNNDGERFGLQRIAGDALHDAPHTFSLEGKKFFLTHDATVEDMNALAQQYDVIICGHIHEVEVRHVHDALVINPGEAGGVLYGIATFVVLTLPDMKTKIVTL